MRKINSNLSSLFWTQFFGALNDNLFKNALIILITFHGVTLFGLNSAMLVALAGAVFIAPFFFLSATSGQLADFYDKTFLVKLIKQIEIAIMLLALIGFIFSNFYLLFFVLFLLGVHSSFFGPLKYALIPFYSYKRDLVFSNALISGGTFVAILLGTIIGGLIAGGFLKFILVLIAILGWYFAKKLPPMGNSTEHLDLKVDWNFNRATKNILLLIFRKPSIAKLTLGLSWFWFMGAGLLSLMPVMAKNIFHANEAVATLFLFTFTLGMGIGPFILEIVTSGIVKKITIPLSLFMMSLFIFDVSYVISQIGILTDSITMESFFTLTNSWRLLFDLFFLSFAGGIYTVSQFSELQNIASSGEISRIIAGNNVLNALFMVAVSLIVMIFFKINLPIWEIFLILGIFNVVVGFIQVYFYRREIFLIP